MTSSGLTKTVKYHCTADLMFDWFGFKQIIKEAKFKQVL